MVSIYLSLYDERNIAFACSVVGFITKTTYSVLRIGAD